MHPIIALWTHPRSISTAFERVMMERRDFNILHEPFSYLYYVHQEGATISQQYVDPDHPTDFDGIKTHVEQAAADGPVFFKDMCSHCYDELHGDDRFLRRLTNTFLIRDPAKAIASYYAMNPQVTVEEIGLRQLSEIHDCVAALDENPVIVDADDLEDDPDGTINAYCQALGLKFIPEAMTWESEQKQEWEIWKDWHQDAAKSTGIVKNMETFEVTVENSDHLKAYYEDQLPYYRALYERRIRPISPS